MNEVVSSTNSSWGISVLKIQLLEPQRIVLVVDWIELRNGLGELEVSEVRANTSTSRIRRNVTLNTCQVVDTFLLVRNTTFDLLNIKDVEGIFNLTDVLNTDDFIFFVVIVTLSL